MLKFFPKILNALSVIGKIGSMLASFFHWQPYEISKPLPAIQL